MTGVLIQYGAVGIIALVALLAVRVLFARMTETVERETERANRLENELRALNEAVRGEYINTITTAAHAITDANRAVADAMAAVRRS